MINRVTLLVTALALALGCSKASHDHDHSHDEPDLSNAAKLVVMVDVLGAEGQRVPLENARIFVKEPHTDTVDHHHHVDGEPNATTNAAGHAEVLIEADKQQVVHVDSPGHRPIVRLVEESAGAEVHINITTAPIEKKTVTIPEEGAVEVTLGNSLGGAEAPVKLTIEAGDLATENGAGLPIAGDIEVTFASWDPARDPASSLPSDLRTASEELFSYSMFSVEFTQGDNVLNVRDGQTITIASQVNANRRELALDAIERGVMNVYSLDHNTGLWVDDEVEATYDEETGTLTSESSHFSHKNYDMPGPYAADSCMNIKAVNRDGREVDASIEVQGFGSVGRNGCIQMACLIGDNGDVISSEDTNGNGVLDEGEDTNGNGRLDGRQDLRVGVAGNVSRVVSASRRVRGYTQRKNNQRESTLCDDTRVGCGVGQCANVEVLLCSPRGEACDERADCCGTDGCFDNVCEVCREVEESCQTSDECCPGSNCLDFKCKPAP